MKLKKLFNWMTVLLTAPSFAVFSFAISGCSKPDPTPPTPPPQPEMPIKIIEPQKKSEMANLKADGSARIVFSDFMFEGIPNEENFSVDGNFSSEHIGFEYDIDSFDIYTKKFNVEITIDNATPTNNLIGQFIFRYKDEVIIPETQSDFVISLLPVPQITLPETRSVSTRIKNGKASITFNGFNSNGIGVPNDLIAIYRGAPTLGSIKNCEIVNFHDNKFGVKLDFEDVAAETIIGNIEFYYHTNPIPTEVGDFSCVLEKEDGKPDFETDSWWQVIEYANDGLAALQEHYGIASFVGLQKFVPLSSEQIGVFPDEYPVTVIGQNADHFKSGTPVALTFQFNNVISYLDGESQHVMYTELWGNRGEYYWYNPEIEEDNECHLRHFMYQKIMPRIDAVIRRNMKPVIKKTTEDEEYSNIIETKETLWCLSPTEMGLIPGKYADEGSCYAYYLNCYGQETSELRNATEFGKEDTAVKWWTRSPHFLVNESGGSQYSQGHQLHIRPAFCI